MYFDDEEIDRMLPIKLSTGGLEVIPSRAGLLYNVNLGIMDIFDSLFRKSYFC